MTAIFKCVFCENKSDKFGGVYPSLEKFVCSFCISKIKQMDNAKHWANENTPFVSFEPVKSAVQKKILDKSNNVF